MTSLVLFSLSVMLNSVLCLLVVFNENRTFGSPDRANPNFDIRHTRHLILRIYEIHTLCVYVPLPTDTETTSLLRVARTENLLTCVFRKRFVVPVWYYGLQE